MVRGLPKGTSEATCPVRLLEQWVMTALFTFAPNDPEQNSIEEVWRQTKTKLRHQRLEAAKFREVTGAFEASLECQVFSSPKCQMYAPSQLA